MSIGPKITAARQAIGISQGELAKRVGVSQAAIAKIESGMVQRTRIAPELARVLQIPLGELDPAFDGQEPVGQRLIAGSDLVGARDLPVFAAAMGGDGHLIVTFEAIEYVRRPQPLEHVKEGYGVLITGESMVPAYDPGDIALVNPRMPPIVDADVVLYHAPPSGEAEAIVKRLLGSTQREWKLRQYNPPLDFTEDRVDWKVCHRVVGKYARR